MENILINLSRKIVEFVQYVEKESKSCLKFFPYYGFNYLQIKYNDPDYKEEVFWGIVYDKIVNNLILFDHFWGLLMKKTDIDYDEEMFMEDTYQDVRAVYINKKQFIELCKRLPNTRV